MIGFSKRWFAAGVLPVFLAACGDEKNAAATGETGPGNASAEAKKAETPAPPEIPKYWSDVSLHKAIRDGNIGYSGNGQFQIDEQGQPQAIVLANCGVANLEPLRGMPLRMLDLQGCPVSNLAALEGMPLVELYLDNSSVEDLAPLAKCVELKKIYLNASNVKDLGPLIGLPIEELNLVGTRVSDLRPLIGMPLKMLWLTDLPVTDISPLAATPLQSLTLHRTRVEDLGPLARLRTLQRLHIGETPVKDLSPIAGLPLTRLVFTPATVEKGMDQIRRIPMMTEIGTDFTDDLNTLMPPSEFWAKYDAGEFK